MHPDIDPPDPVVPSLCVVIATCNRPGTLIDAVRSVLRQEGVSVEVIVVDDSRDHTAAGPIEALGDPRIRYVVNPSPSNGRPAIARNIGLGLAEAETIHCLDDDDLVPAGYYADALAVLAAHPAIGAVFGIIEPFGAVDADLVEERRYFDRATARARRCARWDSRWVFTAAMVFGPTMLVCGAGIIRRKVAQAIGGFDTAMPLMEDVDFYTRAMREGGVRFLDRPALRYRIHSSLMRQPHRLALIEESYRQSQRRYRERRGRVEFVTLKILARGLRLN
ncbi:MAG: glycosyltransferase family 2 protein [Janthinobacterium lividum]